MKLRALPAVASTGPSLRDWIQDYLAHLRVERALAENTVSAYARDLSMLAEHVGAEADVSAIGHEDVASLLGAHAAHGRSGRSDARLLSGLRGFFKFLVREGAIERDPCRLVDSPKILKRLPRPVTPVQVQGMFDAAAENATGETHRAMLLVLFACGIRVSELCGLDVGDLDLVHGRLSVRKAKRGGVRILPVADVAVAAVREYLETVRPLRVAPGETALFVSQKTGRRYWRETIFRIVQGLARDAGIEGRIGPHAIRHGAATALLKGGMSLPALQSLMGHSALTSTAIYLSVDIGHLQKAHAKAHPRG